MTYSLNIQLYIYIYIYIYIHTQYAWINKLFKNFLFSNQESAQIYIYLSPFIYIYLIWFRKLGFMNLNWAIILKNQPKTYFVNWITMTSCFNPIRSYQQCILRSPPLESKPVNIEYRTETITELLVHIPHKQCQIN